MWPFKLKLDYRENICQKITITFGLGATGGGILPLIEVLIRTGINDFGFSICSCWFCGIGDDVANGGSIRLYIEGPPKSILIGIEEDGDDFPGSGEFDDELCCLFILGGSGGEIIAEGDLLDSTENEVEAGRGSRVGFGGGDGVLMA